MKPPQVIFELHMCAPPSTRPAALEENMAGHRVAWALRVATGDDITDASVGEVLADRHLLEALVQQADPDCLARLESSGKPVEVVEAILRCSDGCWSPLVNVLWADPWLFR